MNKTKIGESKGKSKIFESLSNEEFTTKVGDKNAQIYFENICDWPVLKEKFPGEDITSDDLDSSGFMEIKWTFEMDAREWGIKDIVISVKSVKGHIWVELIDSKKEDEIEFDSEGYEIISEIEVSSNICPTSVTIDFSKKTITVS